MQSYLYASSIMAQNCFKYNRQRQKLSKGRQIAVILAGLAIGVVTGLFGAGGGMLTVPSLTFIAKFDEKHSHATAIAVILPLCLISSVVYALGATFENGVVLPTVIGVTIGGAIGALLLKKMSNGAISFLFYALMLFAGLKMIF